MNMSKKLHFLVIVDEHAHDHETRPAKPSPACA